MTRLELVRLLLGLAALAIVVFGAVKVLAPFAVAILWALILASATWPAYRRLRRLFGPLQSLAALTMTSALVVLVVAPVVGLAVAMVREVEPTITAIENWAEKGELALPPWIERIPGAREQIAPWLDRIGDEEVREAWLRQVVLPGERLLRWSRSVLRQVATILVAIFTLFFVYRDGDQLALEARELLDRIAGEGAPLLSAVRETVRAVFFGWILTAAAQGIVAMLGYWLVGLQAPVLLGIVTAIAAIIPFGVGLIWIPAAATLLASGAIGEALFLAAWSLGVVSFIDNFLRPFFISGPSKIPFILVFFGVTGGLIVFGFIGIVLGPVLLAIILALLRQSKEALAARPPAPD